jgi:predicted dehydrogenase
MRPRPANTTPSMAKRLRVGVIGTGAFADACHIPGLQSHPDAMVVAVCGRRAEHTRALANRFGIPEVHTDYRELCAREDVDAITIVTPNACHAEQAIAALSAGKHVLCEKPLGMSVPEVRAMVSAAEASGTVHQVAFTFRYLYGLQELRRRVRRGDLGEPYYLRVQYDSWDGLRPDCEAGWRARRQEAGGGLLYDVGSHLFDVARYVLGPIESTTGFVHHLPRQGLDRRTGLPMPIETDDVAAAWFRHENGIRGQWWVSRATPPSGQNGLFEIIGRAGALRASLSRGVRDFLEISSPQHPEWQPVKLPSAAADGTPHAMWTMMRSFVEACLRGKLDGDVDASFHDGLAAQQGLAAVLSAHAGPGWTRLDETG